MERNGSEAAQKITIPEGKELKSFKLYCSKHGDITDASIALPITYKDISGKEVSEKNVYCMACLNDLLKQFQKNGDIGKIAIVPIVGKKED